MRTQYLKKLISLGFASVMALLLLAHSECFAKKQRPRILVSSDIGGTDPDDFQSMIHLLMYADLFQIEGLVSSPYGDGRKLDFLNMIDLYEKDYPLLSKHTSNFPTAGSLRKLVKQGAIPSAPFKGYATATEGSDWIVKCAKKTQQSATLDLGMGRLRRFGTSTARCSRH